MHKNFIMVTTLRIRARAKPHVIDIFLSQSRYWLLSAVFHWYLLMCLICFSLGSGAMSCRLRLQGDYRGRLQEALQRAQTKSLILKHALTPDNR